MSATKKSNLSISVFVPKDVEEIFDKHKQIKKFDEACGILIGTHSLDELKIAISIATEPDINDIRKRFSFKIKSNKHTQLLHKNFEESGRKKVFLGTWHTHPENDPQPSKCDINDWIKQFSSNQHLFDSMLFLIVGLESNSWFIVNESGIFELSDSCIQYEKRD